MKVIVGDVWTDDHLPCFAVTIDNNEFEVWWTSPDMYGKLELVRDGDITLERALKKYPELLKVLKNPVDPEDINEDGRQNWYTDGGCVMLLPKKANEQT